MECLLLNFLSHLRPFQHYSHNSQKLYEKRDPETAVFVKFLRTPFSIEHIRWLLLNDKVHAYITLTTRRDKCIQINNIYVYSSIYIDVLRWNYKYLMHRAFEQNIFINPASITVKYSGKSCIHRIGCSARKKAKLKKQWKIKEKERKATNSNKESTFFFGCLKYLQRE